MLAEPEDIFQAPAKSELPPMTRRLFVQMRRGASIDAPLRDHATGGRPSDGRSRSSRVAAFSLTPEHMPVK